jgi:hypothetical protein
MNAPHTAARRRHRWCQHISEFSSSDTLVRAGVYEFRNTLSPFMPAPCGLERYTKGAPVNDIPDM